MRVHCLLSRIVMSGLLLGMVLSVYYYYYYYKIITFHHVHTETTFQLT